MTKKIKDKIEEKIDQSQEKRETSKERRGEKKESLKHEIGSNITDLQEERQERNIGKKEFLGKYSLEQKQKFINYLTIIGLILSVILVIYLYINGYFTDRDKLTNEISKLGILAPIIFFIIQVVQVVIPIIPGGVTSVAGVLIFGPLWGFILNYFSILIGSSINFYLGRIYGTALLKIFLNEKTYSKYEIWIEGDNKFPLFFGVAMFLPGMPDDIICILAGITKMRFREFFLIYNLTKPFGLLGYSMFFAYFPQVIEYIQGIF